MSRKSQKLNLEFNENHFELITKFVREKCQKKLEEMNRDFTKICTENEYDNFKKKMTRRISNFDFNYEKESYLLEPFRNVFPLEFDLNLKENIIILKSTIAEIYVRNHYLKPNIKEKMYSIMHEYFMHTGKSFLKKYKESFINGNLGECVYLIENRQVPVGTYGIDNNGGNGRCELISTYLWLSETLKNYLIDPTNRECLEISDEDFLFIGCQVSMNASLDRTRSVFYTNINLNPSEKNIIEVLPVQLIDSIKKNETYFEGIIMLFMGASRTKTNKIIKQKVLNTIDKWIMCEQIDNSSIDKEDLELLNDIRKVLCEIKWKRKHDMEKSINRELNYELDGFDRVASTIPILMLQKYGDLGILYRRVIVVKNSFGDMISKRIFFYECRQGNNMLTRIDCFTEDYYKRTIDENKGYILISTGTILTNAVNFKPPKKLDKINLIHLQMALAANRTNGEIDYKLDSSANPCGPYMPECEKTLIIKNYENLVKSMRTVEVVDKYLGGKTGSALNYKEWENSNNVLELKNGLIHTNYFVCGKEIKNIFRIMLMEKYFKKWNKNKYID